MATYFMIPTQTGQAKIAAYLAGGAPLALVSMAVGDGGGAPVTVADTVAALVGEVHRQALSDLDNDPVNPNWVIAETVLAPDIGGWTIREVGLIDADGDLVAYGNFPDSYKPILSEGSGKELIIRTILEVSDTAAITLTVDSSVLWATQAWVNDQGFASQTWVIDQDYASKTWVAAQGFATQAWVTAQNYAVTAGNLGAGEGQVFSTKAGSTLQLRSIKAGTNVTVTQTGTEITINATGTGVDNTASNLGAGAGQVYASKSGADLRFRSIKAGTNVTVTQTGTEITINATGTGVDNTASNLGTGEGVYGSKVGADLRFKSLKAGSNISLSSTSTAITIDNAQRPNAVTADTVRIPGVAGLDWLIQKGTGTASTSGSNSTTQTIEFPTPFAPGSVPSVQVIPIQSDSSDHPPVPRLTALANAMGCTVAFDLADATTVGSSIDFSWVANGVVDDSGWASGAAITWSGAAGTPATATISVTSGSYRRGTTTKTYAASSVGVTGTGGSTAVYYLWYVDPSFTGGSKTLHASTDPATAFASADNVVVGFVSVAFPASGSGGGSGSTGTGGMGGCVSTAALLIGRNGVVPAGSITVGDELLLCDPATGIEAWGTVTYSQPRSVEGWRLTFDGGTLTCSDTAPIPTELGYVLAPETLGRLVLTRDGEGAQTCVRITDVEHIGALDVQHITVGDRCFWAGDTAGRFVLHHNAKDGSP